MKLLIKIYKYTVLTLTGLFAALLLVQSLWSTTAVYNHGEYYIKDTPLFTLAGVALAIIAACITRRLPMTFGGITKTAPEKPKENNPENLPENLSDAKSVYRNKKPSGIIVGDKTPRLFTAVTGILLLFASIWFVLSVKLSPLGDQLAIINGAIGLENYDFSLFTRLNYYGYWPFQSRITLFLYWFFRLFGEGNHQAFQIMNAICVVWIFYSLSLIAKRGEVFLISGLFFPFILYSTYVYGNIPGLALMMGAIVCLLGYLETGSMKKGLLSAVLAALGLWLKNSYQIIEIAIIVTLIIDCIRALAESAKTEYATAEYATAESAKAEYATAKSSQTDTLKEDLAETDALKEDTPKADFKTSAQNQIIKNITIIACVILFSSAVGKLSDSIVEKRLGFPLSEGSPMVSWITMAFGRTEEGNPVSYDGYNMKVYLDNDGDPGMARQQAMEDLRERLAQRTVSIPEFQRFMARKIARCWNDPTFESIAVNGKGVEMNAWPELLKRILAQDGTSPLFAYANIFHGVVLAGVIFFVISALFSPIDKLPRGELLLCLCFVGGFSFLLFWETLSQYAMVYFLMLIPVAVSGYDNLALSLAAAGQRNITKIADSDTAGQNYICKTADSVSAPPSNTDKTHHSAEPGKKNKPTKNIIKHRIPLLCAATLIILVLLGAYPGKFAGEILHPDHQESLYEEAIAQIELENLEKAAALPDGRYLVTPYTAEGYGIASKGERPAGGEDADVPETALLPIDEENTGIITLHHEHNYDLLRVERTQYLLSADHEPVFGELADQNSNGAPSGDNVAIIQDDDPHMKNMAIIQGGATPKESIPLIQDGDFSMWRIFPAPGADGFYVITIFENYCLTANEGELSITPYTGSPAQLWAFNAAH